MKKVKPKTESKREKRIFDQIVVDAYGADERAMGWYAHLEDTLRFPFTATCIARRAISPLRAGDEVEVIGMAEPDECGHEMFVTIRWERNGLAVPLSQLEPIYLTDSQTRETVADWHYWVRRGYDF